MERYEASTKLYVELKRFVTAGNVTVGVAELFEEQGDLPRATEAYSRASEASLGALARLGGELC